MYIIITVIQYKFIGYNAILEFPYLLIITSKQNDHDKSEVTERPDRFDSRPNMLCWSSV